MRVSGRTPVIGLGAGGHARVLIEALRLGDQFELTGLLDANPALAGSRVLGVPVLGTDDALPGLAEKVHHFLVSMGSTSSSAARVRLYKLAVDLGMSAASVTHPGAWISPSATIGMGTAVLAGAILNACVILGANVIVNTGAILEHDSVIGDHVHIATGARLCGGVQVGSQTHIGAGATVLQTVRIAEQVTVGAGAVVTRDVPPGLTVVGVPAHEVRISQGTR